MTSSSFKKVVRLQFNALMMRTIKGTLKQKRKQLARYSKHEILFSEISTSPLYEQGTLDTYSCNMTVFRVQHFIFRVTDEKNQYSLKWIIRKAESVYSSLLFQRYER